jgi:hypothetical protein
MDGSVSNYPVKALVVSGADFLHALKKTQINAAFLQALNFC